MGSPGETQVAEMGSSSETEEPVTAAEEAEKESVFAMVIIHVSSVGGALCELHIDRNTSGGDVKAAIENETQIEASKQRLVVGSKELRDAELLSELLPEGSTDTPVVSADMLLIRKGKYDGRYKAKPKWNEPCEFVIFGTTVEMGDAYFAIDWDHDDDKKCAFTRTLKGTCHWAQVHTEGKHKEEDGLEEVFHLTFRSDKHDDGFTGTFQRSYEGPLPLQDCQYIGAV